MYTVVTSKPLNEQCNAGSIILGAMRPDAQNTNLAQRIAKSQAFLLTNIDYQNYRTSRVWTESVEKTKTSTLHGESSNDIFACVDPLETQINHLFECTLA